MKLIFFHSSLVGFCEFMREQIEDSKVEDTKGLDTIAELITKTAKEELVELCMSGSISNRDLKMFEDKHRQFFDNNIEGASFVAGLSFYLGKVDDFLGTVAADGRRTGAVTINPKRIARLEQMRGLIQTAIDILEVEYETHLDYAPEQFEADLVKASSVIDSYEGLFDRSRAA